MSRFRLAPCFSGAFLFAAFGIFQNHVQIAGHLANMFQLLASEIMHSTDTFNRNAGYWPSRCVGRVECDKFRFSNYTSAIFLKGENL